MADVPAAGIDHHKRACMAHPAQTSKRLPRNGAGYLPHLAFFVVVATNPAGGIGIRPGGLRGILFGEGSGQGPCHGVANPFDMALWENLPGFDSHHGGRIVMNVTAVPA